MTGIITPTISVLLLLFGTNDLPPRWTKDGTKCPVVKPDNEFRLKNIIGKSYYFNFGTAEGKRLNDFTCIKLRIEQDAKGIFLHISGITQNDKRVQAWHELKMDGKEGHFSLDIRSPNISNHDVDTVMFYQVKGKVDKLFIFTCVRFPVLKQHSQGVIIATNAPRYPKREVKEDLQELRRLTNGVNVKKRGLVASNTCSGKGGVIPPGQSGPPGSPPLGGPIGDVLPSLPGDGPPGPPGPPHSHPHPHPHPQHSHPHPHPHPQGPHGGHHNPQRQKE